MALNSTEELGYDLLKKAKRQGFSDFQIARLVLKELNAQDADESLLVIRKYRKSLGIVPVVKQIDTLAGEYPAKINYLYLSYSGDKHDIEFANDKKSIIVLGSGAYTLLCPWLTIC